MEIRRFPDITADELYITPVDLNSGEMYIFGRDRAESILDAIIANAQRPHLKNLIIVAQQ